MNAALYGTDYSIYLALARLADDFGNVIASQRLIAESSRYAVRTVRRVIQRLEKLGLLRTFHRLGGGKGGQNRYKLVTQKNADALPIASAPIQRSKPAVNQKGNGLWLA